MNTDRLIKLGCGLTLACSLLLLLPQKGISIESGVPHGYVSLSTPRTNERRPDTAFIRNVTLRNFGWTYYHGMVAKVSKRSARTPNFIGLSR